LGADQHSRSTLLTLVYQNSFIRSIPCSARRWKFLEAPAENGTWSMSGFRTTPHAAFLRGCSMSRFVPVFGPRKGQRSIVRRCWGSLNCLTHGSRTRIAPGMNPALCHRKTPVLRHPERSQLPLALEPTQSNEWLPSTTRIKCLRLWRELLQTVVLNGRTQKGGENER
jgi:hypothetical protein